MTKNMPSSSRSRRSSSRSRRSRSRSRRSESRSRSRSSSKTSINVNQIWPKINLRVISYLKERRHQDYEDDKDQRDNDDLNVRSTTEKLLHALMIKTGGKGGAGHEVEIGILFNLLHMMEISSKKSRSDRTQNPKGPDTILLKTEEKVLLLKLIVWAIHEWKTMSTASSGERTNIVRLFEDDFVMTLQKIRIESIISTRVDFSTKSLELLNLMKKIQKLWVGLDIATPYLKKDDLVDLVKEKVEKVVEEKMKYSTAGNTADLLFFEEYKNAKRKLENECSSHNKHGVGSEESIIIQGSLIKEMVQLFKNSVEKDRFHRDHHFYSQIVAGTANSTIDFKRALVWVLMLILPHQEEKSSATRLINCAQGLFRSVMMHAKTNMERKEVYVWREIIESNLPSDDLYFFYDVVVTKKFLNRFYFPCKSVFEDFYPSAKGLMDEDNKKNEGVEEELEEKISVVSGIWKFPGCSPDPWKIKGIVDWDFGTEETDSEL